MDKRRPSGTQLPSSLPTGVDGERDWALRPENIWSTKVDRVGPHLDLPRHWVVTQDVAHGKNDVAGSTGVDYFLTVLGCYLARKKRKKKGKIIIKKEQSMKTRKGDRSPVGPIINFMRHQVNSDA